MAIDVVQPGTPSGNSSGVSSRTFSLTGVTAGNSLVVQFNCESQNQNDAIVFPAGWVVKQAFTQNGYSSTVIAVKNGATAGTNSVTVHFASGTTAGYYYGLMSEVTPLATSPGDLYYTATGTGGTLTPTSGGTATSQASEIVFSVISPDLNALSGTVSQTTPSGFTSIYNETDANNYQTGSSAYKVLTTTQAISAAWTGLTTDSQGWVALIWSLKGATSGPTTYTQAVAGSITAAGSLGKQTNKSLTGALTAAGALTKQTARALSSSITASGVLTAGVIFLMALSGTITAAGALVKQTQRGLSGAITAAGALTKRTALSIAANIAIAGALAKRTVTSRNGSITPAGSLTANFTLTKVLSGAISVTGGLAKSTLKALSGSMQIAGHLAKETRKNLGATIAVAGTVTTSTVLYLTLNGSLTLLGALTATKHAIVIGALRLLAIMGIGQ